MEALSGKEEICIHVIQAAQHDQVEQGQFRLDMRPFRGTFFRYSMFGQSEVVHSTSFVFASHHSSSSAWLDIRKLSVSLVGNNDTPNLALYSPTVKEIYFMGHISYPSTAFHLLTQLTSLEKVAFNIGFGGYTHEFHETPGQFQDATPIIPGVTSLEIKINHRLYRTCPDSNRQTFDQILVSVMKHSAESFPNLLSISVDIPNNPELLHGAINLLANDNLRRMFEIFTYDGKIQINQKFIPAPATLPFDPCARFPNYAQHKHLRRIERAGFH